MGTVKNTIQKARVKDQQLEVIYEEYFPEENYSNTINKKCAQVIHADLQNAFNNLKAHLVCICEMPETEYFKNTGIFDFDKDVLQNYIITGYVHGGSEESAGATIIGQKLLKSGKLLNLVTPFIKFTDEESYPFAYELSADIDACDNEVHEYLFNEKWGVKQLSLDFDSPEESNVSLDEKPKKRGRKKKKEIGNEQLSEIA